jgi:signal transduction histidine kinase
VLVIGCSACLVDYQLAASDGRLWPISRPTDRLALLTFILVGIATALPAQVGRRWQQRAALADAAIEANRLRLELIAALAQEITTPVRALDEYTQELLAGDVEAPRYRREASLQMVAARHPGGPGLIATAPHPL